MTCQCATTSTTNTLVNPFNESLIQIITGLTPGTSIGTLKIGIHACSGKTFRCGVYYKVADDETGDRLAYFESDEISISTPTVYEFSTGSFTVPVGVTELFVVITTSPTGSWSMMYESTVGVINSGYDTTVKYSTIAAQTTGFTFTRANESLINTCLCTGSPGPGTGSGARIPPPPIVLRYF